MWKRNLTFVWISQFLSIMGFALVLPFSPLYVQHLGVVGDEAIKMWAGRCNTATPLCLAVAAPLWGVLADRYGRKLLMVRANACAVLILFSMGFVQNVQQFFFLRCAQGIVTGTVSAAMTMVASYTPNEKQGVALGALSSAVFSGSMTGLFVGGILADLIGYRMTFMVSGTLMILSTVTVVFFVQERFVRPETTTVSARITWRDRIQALGPGAPILILILTTSFARRFCTTILPLFVQELQGGQLAGASRQTGVIYGFGALGAMLAAPLLGRLVDRVSPPTVGKLSAVFAALFAVLIAFVSSAGIIIPIWYLVMFWAAGLDPVFQAWLSRSTEGSRRGRVFGWSVTAKALGWALASYLSARLAILAGNRSVFLVMGVSFVVLLPLIGFVSRRIRSTPTFHSPTST